MQGVNFVAIDFETATARRDSICEAGICVVRNGKVVETRSWLVQPQGNQYNYYNIQVHGIKPQDTAHAPQFPEVWSQILPYIQESPTLVAHNAAFDMSCIRSALSLHGLDTPAITYYCTLRAARRLYDFECNKLDALCHVFDIPCLNHHRAGDDAEMCARIFLRQLKDAGHCTPEQMDFCQGTL
ncbi:MAG: 3'-5' exonuclease [Bacteroidaceae bacterium]|nr:3'-5' exonuclease [Bacteroidaceae bacterium]